MLQEIYLWLEQYSGVSYDFYEDIRQVSDDLIFIEPYEWDVDLNNILNNLSDVLDIIDEYGDDLPDDFPNKISLKKNVTENVVSLVVNAVNNVKQQLHIEKNDITDRDDLVNEISLLSELVDLFIDNTIDDILKKNMFERFDEEHGNTLTSEFNITRNDISSMHITVSSIRQDFFDTLDELDE